MNHKFFDVSKEKQDRIINAALLVFAQNGYRHAGTDEVVRRINELCAEAAGQGKKTGVIATDETVRLYHADCVRSVGSRLDEAAIAHSLYRILREFDDEGTQVMYSEAFSDRGMGQAIMNRLLKAAGHHVIPV